MWESDSAAAAAKSLQSCTTLWDPIDGSPPGSPVPGILQARTLEWVAIPFSNAWQWKVKVKSLSRVRLLATPWTAAHQAPQSMGFSRQEYWSGVPLPSPRVILERLKILQGALWASLSHFATAILPSASFALCSPHRAVYEQHTHRHSTKKARRGASFPLGREVPSSALQDLNEESDLYLIFFPLPPGQGSWNSLWAHLGS